MNKQRLQISYLSDVVDLSTGEKSEGAWTIAETLAVYCVKDGDGFRAVEIELLEGAETLLPHLLPEEFGDVWPPTKWQPKVAYDRERDILRLFNDDTPVTSHTVAENLVVGWNEKGRPVSAEILGAAKLLLPYLLPLSTDVRDGSNFSV